MYRALKPSLSSSFRIFSSSPKVPPPPSLSLLQSQAITDVLFVFADLPFLNISNKWNCTINNHLCLVSFTRCVLFLRFIHVVAGFNIHSPPFLNLIPLLLYRYRTLCFSIYLLIDICPHLLSIVNNAALNIHVKVCEWSERPC